MMKTRTYCQMVNYGALLHCMSREQPQVDDNILVFYLITKYLKIVFYEIHKTIFDVRMFEYLLVGWNGMKHGQRCAHTFYKSIDIKIC